MSSGGPSIRVQAWLRAIEKVRARLGWKQKELAARAGLSKGLFSRWKKGTNQPDRKSELAITGAFGIDEAELALIAAREQTKICLRHLALTAEVEGSYANPERELVQLYLLLDPDEAVKQRIDADPLYKKQFDEARAAYRRAAELTSELKVSLMAAGVLDEDD